MRCAFSINKGIRSESIRVIASKKIVAAKPLNDQIRITEGEKDGISLRSKSDCKFPGHIFLFGAINSINLNKMEIHLFDNERINVSDSFAVVFSRSRFYSSQPYFVHAQFHFRFAQ